MVLPDEALACAVARYHFRPIVGEVVRLLLTNPGSTLHRISNLLPPFCEKHLTERKPTRSPVGDKERKALARDSVTVLIQHGLAYSREMPVHAGSKGSSINPATEPANGKHSKAFHVLYFINIDDLLFRTRLPLYLGCARRSYGDVGEAAVRAIFERGRLTAHQIFKTVLNSVLEKLDINISDAEACLCDMAKSGLLHWCGRRLSSHDGEIHNNYEDDEEIQGSSRVGRKRPFAASSGAYTANGDREVSEGMEDVRDRITVGRKDHVREVGAPKMDNDLDIWGICFWHLNREFRIECCALTLLQRLGNGLAVKVLRAGLQLALQGEDCENPSEDDETGDIGTDAIQRQIEEQHGSVSVQEFWDATQSLIAQTPAFVVPIPEHAPTSLRFVPGRLISDTRQKTLEDLVVKRYGRVGHRVFRALMIEGGMEEKMIAEKCLLPLKVVREHLVKMYQDRMVKTQEVPRSSDQQRASNWYYLWIVNPLSAYRSMLDVMYKTEVKLFARLECLKTTDASGRVASVIDTHESLLTASILRIDQSIMVMRDFGFTMPSYLSTKYSIVDGQIGRVKRRR